MIDSQLIAEIAKSGIFALMFCLLLFYLLKENDRREDKYQNTISKLTDALGVLEEVKVDMREIKKIVKVNSCKSLPCFSLKGGKCYEKES